MTLSYFSFTFYQNSLPTVIFLPLGISQSPMFYFMYYHFTPIGEGNDLLPLDTFPQPLHLLGFPGPFPCILSYWVGYKVGKQFLAIKIIVTIGRGWRN